LIACLRASGRQGEVSLTCREPMFAAQYRSR
jgi:hypothetical protein